MHSTYEVHDDILLLNRVAAGDQGAVAELYDRHSRLLFGLVVRILNNRAEAEEVLQEVFVQAWRGSHTYRAALGSPAGWLLAIARNRAIDRVRAREVRLRAVEGSTAPRPVDTPETLASMTERQRHVRDALEALPGEQRELIERAYFEGLTQSEIAAQLNMPLGTVKTRVRTGLHTLRLLLDGRVRQ